MFRDGFSGLMQSREVEDDEDDAEGSYEDDSDITEVSARSSTGGMY